MSTKTITRSSSLWETTEFINVKAGNLSIGTIQAGWLSAQWREAELASPGNFWIGTLPPLPAGPSKKCADGRGAATFGHKLFFDRRFRANREVSCATSHLLDDSLRTTRTQKALAGEFYCLSPYSDGGSRTNHSGQFAMLKEVLNQGLEARGSL